MAGQVVVFLGVPGAGKSVQAKRLENKFTRLSSGDILRASADTDINARIAAGELVLSAKVEELVLQRLQQVYQDQPILLDGFPRTLSEAEWLVTALRSIGRLVNRVVFLNVPRAEALARLKKRGRVDDSQAAEDERWDEFENQTRPVISYYQGKQFLHEVDGVGTEDEVAERIEAVL